MKTIQKTTSQLKVGDTIEVWWSPRHDTITELRPYKGPLLKLLGEETKLASFALNKCGMTLEAGGIFNVIVP